MSGSGRCRRRPGGDRGIATLWAVGGIAVLCLLAMLVATYGAVVQTRHRADAASDLAALAGAAYAPDGQTVACGKARWVAAGMRVRVTSCRLADWDVLVKVSAALPDGFAYFGPVTARSRAGPADSG
jgi:secretion/DNA translocation related TadE-like protein